MELNLTQKHKNKWLLNNSALGLGKHQVPMRRKTPRLSYLDQVQALMHLTIFKVFSETR